MFCGHCGSAMDDDSKFCPTCGTGVAEAPSPNCTMTEPTLPSGEKSKKSISHSTLALILGILLFLVGCIQPSKYEEAKENGYEVDAKIVDIKVDIEHDLESGYVSTAYTIYADYQVDGVEYKHVKVAKLYDSDKYHVGDTIKTVVNPDNPGKAMNEGGVLCVVGFLIALGGGISKFSSYKRSKKAQSSC